MPWIRSGSACPHALLLPQRCAATYRSTPCDYVCVPQLALHHLLYVPLFSVRVRVALSQTERRARDSRRSREIRYMIHIVIEIGVVWSLVRSALSVRAGSETLRLCECVLCAGRCQYVLLPVTLLSRCGSLPGPKPQSQRHDHESPPHMKHTADSPTQFAVVS